MARVTERSRATHDERHFILLEKDINFFVKGVKITNFNRYKSVLSKRSIKSLMVYFVTQSNCMIIPVQNNSMALFEAMNSIFNFLYDIDEHTQIDHI